jgi:hypothetical protein
MEYGWNYISQVILRNRAVKNIKQLSNGKIETIMFSARWNLAGIIHLR